MIEALISAIALAASVQEQRPPCLPRYIDQHLVYFLTGQSDLDLQGAWRVKLAADYIDPVSGHVIVSSRTDTEGSSDQNMVLAHRRAEAVVGELVRLGIPRSIIEIRALGETQLVRPTPDDTPEPLNRMAHIETGEIRASTWNALTASDCGTG